MFNLNLKERFQKTIKKEIKDTLKNMELNNTYKPKSEKERELKIRKLKKKADLLEAELEVMYFENLKRMWKDEVKELKEEQDYYG